MTAAVKGQAGRVLEFIGDDAETDVRVATVANWSGFSRHQVRAAFGRLKKLGLVERVAVDVWRRVPEVAKPLFGVGDRVRIVGGEQTKPELLDKEAEVLTVGERVALIRIVGGRPIAARLSSLVRLPDADPTPWTPKPPAAWAKDAGAPIARRFPTPFEQSIGRTT